MLVYCLVNKLLTFVKFCLCYLLYNKYALFYILLKLRIEYNSKTFVN